MDDVVEVFHCKELLVALPPDRLGEAKNLLQVIQYLCIPARLVLDLGEGVFFPDRIFDYYGTTLLDIRPYPIDTVGYALGKRAFDVLFSLSIRIVTAPVLSLIALAVKSLRGGRLFSAKSGSA